MNDEAISNNMNAFALQSLPITTSNNTDETSACDTGHSVSKAPTTEHFNQPQQPQKQQQHLNEIHEQLMTYKEDQDISPTSQQQLHQGKKRQRNYQTFPGNSTFFCGGRLMTSQAHWAFIIALLLVIIPSVLFGVFTCPFLWSNIHPVIPVFYAYLFVIAVVSMFKTSWTDPGVIPRGLDPIPTLETFDDHSSIWTQPFPADRCVKIKDEMWNLKYCSTCKIYRPPRASHCRQCDNCVENEDHHCIWLNNCIGKRNYRPFFTFIMTCSLMAIYLIIFAVLHLILAARQIQPEINFDLVFQTAPVSFVLAIVGFFLLWMVGGLTSYHCHLVWKGVTTHEKLRTTLLDAQKPRHPNPYGKTNPVKNIIQVLCRPQPKSHLRRRKYVDSP
ncbi:unnamed protein product [Absidia cylindrospora]